MGHQVRLTPGQGTQFMRMARVVAFPEKVGDRSFSAGMRATFQSEIRQLYKTLKKHSPIFQEEGLVYFGPREWWQKVELRPSSVQHDDISMDDERIRYKVAPGCLDKTITVELTGEARRGLYRLLYLCVHPDSGRTFPAGLQDELVWPVAEELKCVSALESDCELKKKETVEVKWDDEAGETSA